MMTEPTDNDQDIAMAKAFCGVNEQIKKAGGNPQNHIKDISAYALHGRISNNEYEHSAIAKRIMSATPNTSAEGMRDREGQLREQGIL
ncbi:hypothetical protein P3T73_09825 [Kiritimatiellota bacterium B12222]|nr:hypothetical protein P3T73_09825 [Kiritimatiellota bacterium B12222]